MNDKRIKTTLTAQAIESLKKMKLTLGQKTYSDTIITAQKQFADVPAEIVRQDVRKQNEELHKAINKLNNEWKKGNEQILELIKKTTV